MKMTEEPTEEPYRGKHRNALAALGYRFPSHGGKLLEALLGEVLTNRIKITTNWVEKEKALILDVRTKPFEGPSAHLQRYRVSEETKNGQPVILLEEIGVVYTQSKATDYGRKILGIPTKEPKS